MIIIFNAVCLLHYSFETWSSNSFRCFPLFLLITLYEDPLVIMYHVMIITNNEWLWKTPRPSLLLHIPMGKWKKFSKNYLQFGHATSKRFTNILLGQKNVRNIGFKERQIIACLGCWRVVTPLNRTYHGWLQKWSCCHTYHTMVLIIAGSLLYVGDVNITWWTCLMMMMIDTNYCLM